MALTPECLSYIESCISDVLGSIPGRSMIELGDQVILAGERPIRERTGKSYFQSRGVNHVSVDLNGRHGAIRCDLAHPVLRPEWLGAFDVVTNAGTTEHVEPYEAQYECFKNAHDLLAVRGIAVHIVPDVEELEAHGRWRNHCRYYYSQDFFQMLAEQNGYRLVSSKVVSGLRRVCLEKTVDAPFMKDRVLFLSKIVQRSRGMIYPVKDSRVWRLLSEIYHAVVYTVGRRES